MKPKHVMVIVGALWAAAYLAEAVVVFALWSTEGRGAIDANTTLAIVAFAACAAIGIVFGGCMVACWLWHRSVANGPFAR